LKEIYGVEVSPDLITTVTDGVLEEVKAWRARLKPSTRSSGLMPCSLRSGRTDESRSPVNLRGRKEVLGLWSSASEGAKFWLEQFAEKWDARYPTIARSWRANWTRIIPMFGLPAEIRKAIYTTNAIESLNFSLRKIIRTRGSFPNEEAAFKLLYPGLKNIAQRWTMPIANWRQALKRVCHSL
jgi:transposase-like protein